MDELKITDLRTIQYCAKGNDWSFTVGQNISSIDSKIHRIYLDDPYLMNTGLERYIIEVLNKPKNIITPWRIIQFSRDGSANVIELML